ncbi:hypothetical protein J4526_00385 [Desulfurococcaceae archaeon MEX13E-LK6-19]|nr:hypothetical protein J4526_00385 [Desulfurococcaceae archaeon MEX13E-LK6-19]
MSKPGIYVKLAAGWIRVKEKIARPRTSKKSSRSTTKVSLTYSMVGESIDGEPSGKKFVGEFLVSAFKISKYIMKIIDIVDNKAVVIVEPISRETYRVRVYDTSEELLEELKRIALETKALRIRIPKQKQSESTEKPSS